MEVTPTIGKKRPAEIGAKISATKQAKKMAKQINDGVKPTLSFILGASESNEQILKREKA